MNKESLYVGNATVMREALVKADAAFRLISKSAWFIDANFSETKEVMEAGNAIAAALSAPPRNCDVGTANEQIERHQKWCNSDRCVYKNRVECFAEWSHMPYKEGETK